jgi:hypothetical protein
MKSWEKVKNCFSSPVEYKNLYTKIKELELECGLMFRYISSIGKEIPKEIIDEMSELSVFTNRFSNEADLVKLGLSEEELQARIKLALNVHNRLNILCKPANAISIRYTEYKRGFILRNNPVVNTLLALTLLSLAAYITFKVIPPFLSEGGMNSLIIISASGLGAGFYTLLTVRSYLINRSYNPRYNPSYLIRFFLGIAAGTILAFMFEEYFKETKFSIEILAVVGGFAADAVGVILKRISEILIAAFKGIEDTDEHTEELIEQKEQLATMKTKINGLDVMHKIEAEAIKLGVSPKLIKIIKDSIDHYEKN